MGKRKMLGAVELLGLGAFGGNGKMNPVYGMLIGGGSAAVTTIAARHAGLKEPELVGFGIGLATSGVMAAMKSTRKAALGGVFGSVIGAGIWFLEKKLMGAATLPVAPATAAAVSGIGYPNLRALNGLGIPTARALNGIGVPTIAPVSHAAGTIPGVAGSQLASPGGGNPPISLMGTPSAAAVHLLGIGGPPIHGLSAAYGATLLGAGR